MEDTKFKIDPENVEQQKAFDLVAYTNTSLFITGKAGTGKTTFVKWIQKEIDKNFLILAPTGIAALNVGGQTMHSFFGFPLEIIGPRTRFEVSQEKRETLENIDTIIIDEASMVRADMVDGMDRFLRFLNCTHLPFGGKQVVFVGDLFQLPPVYKKGSADEEMLRALYGSGTPYFYKSYVLKQVILPKIEFQKVYRQQEEPFLSILNRMRVGDNTQEDFEYLNERVSNDNKVGDYSVTLTAYNKIAESINNMRLDEIETEEFCYEGVIEGKFKPQDAPVPAKLSLKVGAQVIFCRNDYPRGVVNGTIAIVTELSDEQIKVRLENGNELKVEQMEWVSKESVYNPKTKKVESEVVGTFVQYPIKLAWAITIHKSQGMTFDRMHFDLTRGTFAPGQAYVAISRMRSIEGLTLSNKLRPYHIVQNTEVRAFANSFNDLPMIEEELAFGQQFAQYYNKQDYDGAAMVCLLQMIDKIRKGDYRNAALMAKRMFDVMFDDVCLMGMTKETALLKDCSMTCNFLNAVLCLYSGRYEEAIGYADMVLDRKECLEAMFIKGRALYALKQYEEALAVHEKIVTISSEAEEKVAIDKKQYLFEARTKQSLGKSTMDACRHLVKLCPNYVPAYTLIREEAMANGYQIEMGEDENELVTAFNNKNIEASDFEKLTEKADKTSVTFRIFNKKIRIFNTKDVNL
ncbi:MAG: AAA family ATPase [Bacteroidales bacterium]|nr:AAA family ATPase [Bacteroidales bacterium]